METYRHITVRLPQSLARWLRVEAAKQDTSRSHLIRHLLLSAMLAADTPTGRPDAEKGVQYGTAN